MTSEYKKRFEELIDLSSAFYNFPIKELNSIVEESVSETINNNHYNNDRPLHLLIDNAMKKAMSSFEETREYMHKITYHLSYGAIESNSAGLDKSFIEYSIDESGSISIFGIGKVFLDKIKEEKASMDDPQALADVLKKVIKNIFYEISTLDTVSRIYGKPDTLIKEFILSLFFVDSGGSWGQRPGENHKTDLLKLAFTAGKKSFTESLVYTGGLRNAISVSSSLSTSDQEKLTEVHQRLSEGYIIDLEKVYNKAESLLFCGSFQENGVRIRFSPISTRISVVSNSYRPPLPGLGRKPYIEGEESLIRPMGSAFDHIGHIELAFFNYNAYSILTFRRRMYGDMALTYIDLFHDALSPKIIEVAERNYNFLLKHYGKNYPLLNSVQRTIMSA